MKRKPEAVGTFIQHLLEEKKLDLDTLSRDCSIPSKHLAQLIAGEQILTGDVAMALAEYFERPAVELLDVQRNYLIDMRE